MIRKRLQNLMISLSNIWKNIVYFHSTHIKLMTVTYSVLSITVIIAVIIGVSGLKNEDFIAEQGFVTECQLIKGENKYEIRGYSDGYLYFYVNEKRKEKLSNYTNVNSYISLLSDESVAPVDISTLTMTMDLTYSAGLEQSTGVVKKLKDEGFKIIRQFNCPRYIEIFMSNDTVMKRLIITKTFIMCGDLNESSILPTANSYFSSYNIKYDIEEG